jgi:hypothetical protein
MDPGREMFTVTKTPTGTVLVRSGHPNKDESKLDSIVMMPILSQTEHCARCGAAFMLEENHATACTFHADQDGEPGEYKDMVIKDELTGVQSVLQAWSCCGRHHAFAAGCSARPHTCREVMIQVRAEANPTTRVENVDLSVLKSVDISIFPNSTYDLQVHITKSLADVLHKYFSIDDMENYEITANIAETTEAEEKQQSRWKRVRNVRNMLLQKKNKTGSADGDDEASMFSGDDMSTGQNSPMLTHGSEKLSPSMDSRSTTPIRGGSMKDHRVAKSGGSAGWFGSTTPKNSNSAMETSTHSDSTESTTGTAAGSKKSSFFGGLFGKKDKKKRGAEADRSSPLVLEADTTPGSAASTPGASGAKQLKFNMMRARSTSRADHQQHHHSHHSHHNERRSFTASSHGASSNTAESTADHKAATTTVAHRRQEGVYVKFLMLNLTKFKAQMDEFRCQGEVLQWNTLVFNMERHMAVSLFTNAASNSLSRFTQLFRFTGHAVEGAPGGNGEAAANKTKSSKWEATEDPHMAAALKRSALGLPPAKTKPNDAPQEENGR